MLAPVGEKDALIMVGMGNLPEIIGGGTRVKLARNWVELAG